MGMITPFLKYVSEGRVIRRFSDLQRFTFPEVCQRIYISVLALTFLKFTGHDRFVKSYVEQTLGYGTFDKVRMSQNDLYNMMAIVSGDPEITKKLKNKNQAQALRQRQSMPVMAFRRYIRTWDNPYGALTQLERGLGIFDANLRNIRRGVANYNGLNSTDKKMLQVKLLNVVNQALPGTDIHKEIRSKYSK
jgi:hypothetical protein